MDMEANYNKFDKYENDYKYDGHRLPPKKCLNCGKYGHIARNCYSPIYCNYCGQPGHEQKYCYKNYYGKKVYYGDFAADRSGSKNNKKNKERSKAIAVEVDNGGLINKNININIKDVNSGSKPTLNINKNINNINYGSLPEIKFNNNSKILKQVPVESSDNNRLKPTFQQIKKEVKRDLKGKSSSSDDDYSDIKAKISDYDQSEEIEKRIKQTVDKKVCKFYYNTGYCLYGNKCKFSHDIKPLHRICSEFNKFGYCYRGNTCRFEHINVGFVDPVEPAESVSLNPDSLWFGEYIDLTVKPWVYGTIKSTEELEEYYGHIKPNERVIDPFFLITATYEVRKLSRGTFYTYLRKLRIFMPENGYELGINKEQDKARKIFLRNLDFNGKFNDEIIKMMAHKKAQNMVREKKLSKSQQWILFNLERQPIKIKRLQERKVAGITIQALCQAKSVNAMEKLIMEKGEGMLSKKEYLEDKIKVKEDRKEIRKKEELGNKIEKGKEREKPMINRDKVKLEISSDNFYILGSSSSNFSDSDEVEKINKRVKGFSFFEFVDQLNKFSKMYRKLLLLKGFKRIKLNDQEVLRQCKINEEKKKKDLQERINFGLKVVGADCNIKSFMRKRFMFGLKLISNRVKGRRVFSNFITVLLHHIFISIKVYLEGASSQYNKIIAIRRKERELKRLQELEIKQKEEELRKEHEKKELERKKNEELQKKKVDQKSEIKMEKKKLKEVKITKKEVKVKQKEENGVEDRASRERRSWRERREYFNCMNEVNNSMDKKKKGKKGKRVNSITLRSKVFPKDKEYSRIRQKSLDKTFENKVNLISDLQGKSNKEIEADFHKSVEQMYERDKHIPKAKPKIQKRKPEVMNEIIEADSDKEESKLDNSILNKAMIIYQPIKPKKRKKLLSEADERKAWDIIDKNSKEAMLIRCDGDLDCILYKRCVEKYRVPRVSYDVFHDTLDTIKEKCKEILENETFHKQQREECAKEIGVPYKLWSNLHKQGYDRKQIKDILLQEIEKERKRKDCHALQLFEDEQLGIFVPKDKKYFTLISNCEGEENQIARRPIQGDQFDHSTELGRMFLYKKFLERFWFIDEKYGLGFNFDKPKSWTQWHVLGKISPEQESLNRRYLDRNLIEQGKKVGLTEFSYGPFDFKEMIGMGIWDLAFICKSDQINAKLITKNNEKVDYIWCSYCGGVFIIWRNLWANKFCGWCEDNCFYDKNLKSILLNSEFESVGNKLKSEKSKLGQDEWLQDKEISVALQKDAKNIKGSINARIRQFNFKAGVPEAAWLLLRIANMHHAMDQAYGYRFKRCCVMCKLPNFNSGMFENIWFCDYCLSMVHTYTNIRNNYGKSNELDFAIYRFFSLRYFNKKLIGRWDDEVEYNRKWFLPSWAQALIYIQNEWLIRGKFPYRNLMAGVSQRRDTTFNSQLWMYILSDFICPVECELVTRVTREEAEVINSKQLGIWFNTIQFESFEVTKSVYEYYWLGKEVVPVLNAFDASIFVVDKGLKVEDILIELEKSTELSREWIKLEKELKHIVEEENEVWAYITSSGLGDFGNRLEKPVWYTITEEELEHEDYIPDRYFAWTKDKKAAGDLWFTQLKRKKTDMLMNQKELAIQDRAKRLKIRETKAREKWLARNPGCQITIQVSSKKRRYHVPKNKSKN